jgi:hypothetical protein
MRRTTAASAGLIFRSPAPSDVVAKGPADRDLTLEGPAQLPPSGLLGEVPQIHLRHGAEHADVHGCDLAGGDRVQPNPQEAEAVVQIRNIRELAPEPVQGLGEDQIEAATVGVGLHLLERRPKPARPAQRAVGVDLDHRPALPLGMAAADLDLILDRRLALVVQAVAGIERTAQHGVSSG